jgi:hypothetical protein
VSQPYGVLYFGFTWEELTNKPFFETFREWFDEDEINEKLPFKGSSLTKGNVADYYGFTIAYTESSVQDDTCADEEDFVMESLDYFKDMFPEEYRNAVDNFQLLHDFILKEIGVSIEGKLDFIEDYI